ncbi:MAG: FAD:protein FMN transferase [Burkholderiales bacterium]|nr:FAD:protein FMN transferase [Burkholderiales bacterium]
MGTAIRVELWSTQRALAEQAMAAVMTEMHRIDRCMSPHHAYSELSRINRDAAFAPVPLSAEMAGLLARAIEFSALSGGAFDISYAAVGQLYDYRRGLRPEGAALDHARAAVGWQHLVLNPQARTLRFARHGMRIDLGGFAKGHAVDRCIALLRERGIEHAMVSAGGDSHVLGDRRGRPWNVAIRDPRREGGVVALLPLQDTAVSTSGDYERYFERDGERCHHILDPRSGRSPTGLRSVTILADDGLTAEALSKTLFVLGLERGMALVEGQAGVDAVVVDDQGRLHCSSGLQAGNAAASGKTAPPGAR